MSPKPKRRGKVSPGSRQNVPARSNQVAGSGPVPQAQPAAGALSRPLSPARAGGVPKSLPRLDYVKNDLKKIAVTAASIVVIIVVLAIALPR